MMKLLKNVSSKKIGDLNGGYAILLRIMLVLLPIDIYWRVHLIQSLSRIDESMAARIAVVSQMDEEIHKISARTARLEALTEKRVGSSSP